MISNNLDQLNADATDESEKTKSAPGSRRNSLKTPESGSEKTKHLDTQMPVLLGAARTLSNCSSPQCSPQPMAKLHHDGLPGGSELGSSPRMTERPFKSRSYPSPCPSSSSSSSPATSELCPRLKTSVQHHSSSHSAALARDFFGQKSSVSDPFPRHDDKLDVKPRGKMTTSPLLRRQATVGGRIETSMTLSPSLIHHLQVGLPQLQTTTLSPLPSPHVPRLSPDKLRTPSMESRSADPPSPSSFFRVVVLGDDGVGKSTLIRQLTTGTGVCDISFVVDAEGQEDEDRDRVVVTIDRNQERCTLEIFDSPLNLNIDALRPDAFIVIYSVSDPKSYVTATEVMQHLRYELGTDRPVFIVANKTDLRRQQRVAAKGAKDLADACDCCFMETSAALRMNIDRLLSAMVDRILTQLQPLPPGKATLRSLRSAKQRSTTSSNAFQTFSKLIRQTLLRRSLSSDNVWLKRSTF